MSDPEPKARRVLGWLGFGPQRAPSAGEDEAAAPVAEPVDPREHWRLELLGQVSGFLVTHRLDVNPYMLAIAHDVVTGADARLARLVEQRLAARLPLTAEWLDEACHASGRNEGTKQLDALMVRLDGSIQQFTSTTCAAKTAANDYNWALEQHVQELEQVSSAGHVITELAKLARDMLDRTREIEREMSRSELQTRELKRNLEEARRTAELDHLTGLPNRRAFDALLAREHAAALDDGAPLCVAFCDIDHFKRVNDTHGHDAGDRVIRAVAQTLAKIAHDGCHVARHGGEEFVIVFCNTALDEAWTILDRAREAMGERRLVNRATDVPFGRITFSAGIADVFAHPTPGAALKAADDALYAAKAAGRDCVLRAPQAETRAAA